MQAPIYQGPRPAVSRTSQLSIPTDNPMASTWQRSAAVQTATAYNFEQAIRDRQEFILEQNRSTALQDASSQMEMELAQRLALADGAPGSFYDENGLLNKDEVAAFKQKYTQIADAWTSGFTSEQGYLKATEAQRTYRSSVNSSVDSKIAAALKSRAAAALRSNLRAAVVRRDYDGGRRVISDAHVRGQVSDADATSLTDEVDGAEASHLTEAATSPEELERVRASQAAYLERHPEAADKINKKAVSLLTTEPKPTKRKSRKKDGSETEVDALSAPPAAPGYVKYFFACHGANLKSPEAQQAAGRYLAAEAATHLDLSTDTEASLRARGKSYGMTEAQINAVINTRKKQLDASTPDFDPAKAAKTLSSYYSYNYNKDNSLSLFQKALGLQKNTLDAALFNAQQDYNTWLAQNPNANSVQQAREFQKIVHQRLEQDTRLSQYSQKFVADMLASFDAPYEASHAYNHSLSEQDKKTAKQQAGYLRALSMRYEAISADPDIVSLMYDPSDKGAVARAAVSEALLYQAATLNFSAPCGDLRTAAALPGTNDDLILYVGKDDEISGRSHFIATHNNSVFSVKIRISDKITAPTPSNALQAVLGIYGSSPVSFTFQNNSFSFEQDFMSGVEPSLLPRLETPPTDNVPSPTDSVPSPTDDSTSSDSVPTLNDGLAPHP